MLLSMSDQKKQWNELPGMVLNENNWIVPLPGRSVRPLCQDSLTGIFLCRAPGTERGSFSPGMESLAILFNVMQ